MYPTLTRGELAGPRSLAAGRAELLSELYDPRALLFRAPYYVAAELLWNGQTLGRRAVGLRVVSADGRSLRAVRNIMREFGVFVPGAALFVAPLLSRRQYVLLLAWRPVLLAVPLCNRRRQRLGDMIAGTLSSVCRGQC